MTTTPDKIIESKVLLVIQRLSFPLLGTMIGIIAFLGWGKFEDVSQSADAAVVQVATVDRRVNDIQERTSILESNQSRGRADREKYQDQVFEQLSDIARNQVELGKQVAASIAIQIEQGKRITELQSALDSMRSGRR